MPFARRGRSADGCCGEPFAQPLGQFPLGVARAREGLVVHCGGAQHAHPDLPRIFLDVTIGSRPLSGRDRIG
jgi:hypothetical protein